MTYRYVFVLEQEYQRLMRAVKIRGFQPATNLHTYRTYAYVVGMLFVRAAERAERVQQAMLCRGFKRKFYCLQEFKAGRGGLIFSLLMSAALFGLVVIDEAHHALADSYRKVLKLRPDDELVDVAVTAPVAPWRRWSQPRWMPRANSPLPSTGRNCAPCANAKAGICYAPTSAPRIPSWSGAAICSWCSWKKPSAPSKAI